MPNLYKGQDRSVSVMLKRSLTDVEYSAHISIMYELGQFNRWREMFVEAIRQLRDALFEFLPSGGVDGCKSHILMLFDLPDYCFTRQMYAGNWAYRRGGVEAGKPRK